MSLTLWSRQARSSDLDPLRRILVGRKPKPRLAVAREVEGVRPTPHGDDVRRQSRQPPFATTIIVGLMRLGLDRRAGDDVRLVRILGEAFDGVRDEVRRPVLFMSGVAVNRNVDPRLEEGAGGAASDEGGIVEARVHDARGSRSCGGRREEGEEGKGEPDEGSHRVVGGALPQGRYAKGEEMGEGESGDGTAQWSVMG